MTVTFFFAYLGTALLPLMLAFEVYHDLDSNHKDTSDLERRTNVMPLQSRIIGGQQAPLGAYPFFATVYWNDISGVKCGGSLIHSDVVLTAGTV